MYLKSPRRRREKSFIVKCIEKYFSVPKIASPEARKEIYIENVQGQVTASPGAEPSAGRMYYFLQGQVTASPGAEPSAGRWWWWWCAQVQSARAKRSSAGGGGGGAG